MLLLTALLGLKFIWLLSSELLRADVVTLPTNVVVAATAAKQRDRAEIAAAIGIIRGQLWAQSAFTYADLMFAQDGGDIDATQQLARARASLERALNEAPVQAGPWLLCAGLGMRHPSAGFDVTEALKMSYYTGPSEEELMPLRLRMAVASGAMRDIETRPLVLRDLRFLLARKRLSAIAKAYNAASPPEKRLIEQTLSDVDRSAAESLRAGAQKRSLPD